MILRKGTTTLLNTLQSKKREQWARRIKQHLT